MQRFAVGTVTLVVALALAQPVDASSWGTADTNPVSRDYIDPVTLLVYDYDATTGILTPTGAAGSYAGYATVWPQTRPYCNTADYCIVGLVAITGAHSVSYNVKVYASGSGALVSNDNYGPYSSPTPVVTYNLFDRKYDFSYCTSLTVTQYIDGAWSAQGSAGSC